jgi:hypothetical protein
MNSSVRTGVQASMSDRGTFGFAWYYYGITAPGPLST